MIELELRVFFPGDNVLEDPGTGSLAGLIDFLAHKRWGLNVDPTVKQSHHVGRPCRIDVHGDPDSVRVGGPVSRFAEGVMTI